MKWHSSDVVLSPASRFEAALTMLPWGKLPTCGSGPVKRRQKQIRTTTTKKIHIHSFKKRRYKATTGLTSIDLPVKKVFPDSSKLWGDSELRMKQETKLEFMILVYGKAVIPVQRTSKTQYLSQRNNGYPGRKWSAQVTSLRTGSLHATEQVTYITLPVLRCTPVCCNFA